MTRHRSYAAREGSGLVFNSQKSRALAKKVSLVDRQNAKRVPCPKCGLLILPGAMAAHDSIVHEED